MRESFPAFEPLDRTGVFKEMRRFIESLELDGTVFRSDHASNWLVLKGTLNADRERMLAQLEHAIDAPDRAPLRPAWMRGR